jgi:hypothetical protein
MGMAVRREVIILQMEGCQGTKIYLVLLALLKSFLEKDVSFFGVVFLLLVGGTPTNNKTTR